jgi:hypothetical protein
MGVRDGMDLTSVKLLEKFSGDLHDACEKVQSDDGLTLVDLPFSDGDRATFEELQITQNASLTYYGGIDGLEVPLMNIFALQTDDSALQKHCVRRMMGITKATLAAFGKKAGYIGIRSMTATDGSPMRWHQDGKMFDRETPEKQMKLVFCFRGESTYLASVSDDAERERFARTFAELNALYVPAETDGKWRIVITPEIIAKQAELNAIIPASSIVVPETAKQGAVFAVGSEREQYHSEPPMREPRLFAFVVPGTEEEVESMRVRNGAQAVSIEMSRS